MAAGAGLSQASNRYRNTENQIKKVKSTNFLGIDPILAHVPGPRRHDRARELALSIPWALSQAREFRQGHSKRFDRSQKRASYSRRVTRPGVRPGKNRQC